MLMIAYACNRHGTDDDGMFSVIWISRCNPSHEGRYIIWTELFVDFINTRNVNTLKNMDYLLTCCARPRDILIYNISE